MRAHLPLCALLLVLAACASHPPHCGGRLTPINALPLPVADVMPGPRRAAAHVVKAAVR